MLISLPPHIVCYSLSLRKFEGGYFIRTQFLPPPLVRRAFNALPPSRRGRATLDEIYEMRRRRRERERERCKSAQRR